MLVRKRHTSSNTEVLLSGSKVYMWIERIGLVLHFLAFFLGILALIGLSWFEELEAANITLEVFTLIVVFLILLNHILRPVFKKLLIKRFLKEFWFKTDIINTFSIPLSTKSEVQVDEQGQELISVNYRKLDMRDRVDIEFKRVTMFKWELDIDYTSLQYFESTYKWKMDHIFIDVSKKIMEIDVTLENDIFEKIQKYEPDVILPSSDFVYTIDLERGRASWIGKNHNNTPTWFGEWNIVKD